MDTPDWTKHAVFYQIFPDRFAKSDVVPKLPGLEPWDSPPSYHGYKGGDLLGIVAKLDYLHALGVNALYLNPIFQSASNHRYHTYDYFHVDPMLGGNAALRQLIEACKSRGMRIILDAVFNHCSRGFFAFHDVAENGAQSPYCDWFHIHSLPLRPYGEGEGGYACWWGMKALPKLNTANPAVREMLWRVGEYWLEFGIDGWRLDVPNEIDDDDFWHTFRQRCRAVKPDCYIVGEIWDDPTRWLQGDQFDAVMHYPFTRAIYGLVGAGNLNDAEIARCGYQHIPPLSAQQFATRIDTMLAKYPAAINQVQFNLLGSHDTPRALTVLQGDRSAYQMALAFQFSFVGAPSIYYGDEIGLRAGHDPANRQGMPWDEAVWDTDILALVKQLIQLRMTHEVLRLGDYQSLQTTRDTYYYLRCYQGVKFLGIINAGHHEVHLELDPSAQAKAKGEYQQIFCSRQLEPPYTALRLGTQATDTLSNTQNSPRLPARSVSYYLAQP